MKPSGKVRVTITLAHNVWSHICRMQKRAGRWEEPTIQFVEELLHRAVANDLAQLMGIQEEAAPPPDGRWGAMRRPNPDTDRLAAIEARLGQLDRDVERIAQLGYRSPR